MAERADQLDYISTITNDRLIILPDATTGKLYRSTVGAFYNQVVAPDMALKADLVNGIVPSYQLPSYVDEILEYPTVASLPAIGQTGKIYVITTGDDANKIFRWSGSLYVQVGGSGDGSDIAAEIAARIAADNSLQNQIDNEIAARSSADTNEASVRAAADITLQNNINGETVLRANADTTLQNNINSEVNTRANADATLQTNINAEAIARANADANLQAQIDLKLNISDYNDRYKGKYTTLSALQSAHPTSNAGDYAQVDAGAGHDVVNYNWDVEDGWVPGSSMSSPLASTDDLPEGSTNLYFTTARVLATLSGTLNRISFTSGVIDIASTYIGQSSISTLGTIVTGTWNGSTIGSGYGGTGFTGYSKGDIIFASAINTLSKLSAGTDGYVLTLAAGVPTWSAIASDLPTQTGNNGKFLTTNGSSSSWATIPSSPWTIAGSDIYYTGGKVAIGISSGFLSNFHLVANSLGSSISDSSGIILQNSTASVSGTNNNQVSPALIFSGTSYVPTGSLSKEVRWRIFNNTQQGVGSTSAGNLLFQYSLDGGSTYTTQFALWSNNSSTFTGNLTGINTLGATTLNVNGSGTFGAYVNSFRGTSYSSGTNTDNIFYGNGTINNTGGTNIYRAFYFIPNITGATGTTIIGFQNTRGYNLFNSSAGESTGVGVSSTSNFSSSALFQIDSTTQGFLPARMTTTQRTSISSPAEGLEVYDLTLHKKMVYDGSTWQPCW
ncbi:MAG TPA: hypothetical protein VG847_06070 [Chitinophagaceae bacterium]|nr:hypothetical protein [Chitinophagaceae bacterium]